LQPARIASRHQRTERDAPAAPRGDAAAATDPMVASLALMREPSWRCYAANSPAFWIAPMTDGPCGSPLSPTRTPTLKLGLTGLIMGKTCLRTSITARSPND